MRRLVLYVVWSSVLILTGMTWAGDELTPPAPPSLKLNLSDGSHIIGVSSMEWVSFQTSYARMDLPLKQIRVITIKEDHETASVILQNGDNLNGVVILPSIRLRTVFGEISIDSKYIKELRVMLAGSATTREGLVFWNSFEGKSDVENSRVGPGGKVNGGRFVQGRFGKGIQLNMEEQFKVSFPVDIIPASAGCVEFWAKLVDFPEALPWGQRPALLSIADDQNNQRPFLQFNGNDGVPGGIANGGLCAILNGIGRAGTSQHGSWTYSKALSGGNIADWHHYALVWSTDVFSEIDDGTHRIAIYVDGRLNSGFWRGTEPMPRPLILPTSGRLGLLTHQGMPACSIVYDNLKIWNYAKRNFSDRDNE